MPLIMVSLNYLILMVLSPATELSSVQLERTWGSSASSIEEQNLWIVRTHAQSEIMGTSLQWTPFQTIIRAATVFVKVFCLQRALTTHGLYVVTFIIHDDCQDHILIPLTLQVQVPLKSLLLMA